MKYGYILNTGQVILPFFICTPQVPLVAVDSYFYGKLVIAPLNILLYNVFTPHGPDLYGMFLIIWTFINLNFLNIRTLE